MINLIKKCLKKFPVVSDWTIKVISKNQEELYLIFNKPEALRSIEEELYTITVYLNVEVDGDKQTGTGTTTFNRSITEKELTKLLETAVFSAQQALNPHFEISDFKDNQTKYELCDAKIMDNPRNELEQIQLKMLSKFGEHPEVQCASAEIFITKGTQSFYTSRGVNDSHEFTSIMLETVILAGNDESEVESSLFRKEALLSVLDIDHLLERYIGYAKDNLSAELPISGRYPVIFTEEALDTFFSYHTSQISGGMIYNRMNKFEVNNNMVADSSGEKLSLSFDPTLKGGVKSGKYDDFGTLLEKFTPIEDNVFKVISANKRYADYLKCSVTGSQSNLIIKSGSLTYSQLLEDGCFILSRFSTFTPHEGTGHFSGEIRNGFFYKNGNYQPVKGGSVTGSMDEAFKKIYFSKETRQQGSYNGPLYIKIAELDITGV